MENRCEERQTQNASIMFSPFSTQYWYPNHAKVGNSSSNGMFFLTNHPLRQGATIYIRTETNAVSAASPNPASEPVRTVTLAQVKWCRPLADSSNVRFGIGVRYL
jgi:hypothetical protein